MDLYHKVHTYADTISVQHPVYREHFTRGIESAIQKATKRGEKPTILVSGASDFRTLELVRDTLNKKTWYAFEYPHHRGKVNVVDIHEKPVQENRAFIKAIGESATIQKADVRRLPSQFKRRNHHAVITDSFLHLLSDPDKQRVLVQWNRALKKGGTVITTVACKIRDSPRMKRVRSLLEKAQNAGGLPKLKPFVGIIFALDPAERKAFQENARQLAAARLELTRQGLMKPFDSMNQLEELCKETGFRLQIVKPARGKNRRIDPQELLEWHQVILTKTKEK